MSDSPIAGGGTKRSRKSRRSTSPRKKTRKTRKTAGSPKRRSTRKSRSPSKMRKYAKSTTQAGRYREVFEGRAELTRPGGLRKNQLTKSKSGRIVSKKRSNQPLNPFIKASTKARKANAESFEYNGNTYRAKKTSTGLVVYKKS